MRYLGAPTVEAIARWQVASGIVDGPLFRAVNKGGIRGGRIDARSLRAIIARRARAAGITGRVSGHSLRVGAAQSLAAAGAGLVELQGSRRLEGTEHARALRTPPARRPRRRRQAPLQGRRVGAVKALTVRQPFASLIASGAKTVEVRSRRTHYRGPLVIHAACRLHDLAGPDDAELPRGVLLCVVELVDCVPFTPALASAACVPWVADAWAWVLRGPQAVPPRRVRGSLGLWSVDSALVA